ncbi:glycosyltransferase family 39 protein [Leptobacterium sp. I13]|uniref:ArnT family glycosyltransferase n=1 Tax=Leptobacterium meishanense TaxID=3128904 RepID=UPI0030EED3F6
MYKNQKPVHFFYSFIFVLTIVNLVQGYATELILDESYYWYFSQHLSWGYFDHPPMVALLVKIGSVLFKGELGIRFFASFLFSGTIILLWKLIDDPSKYKHIILFCLLTGSVALFNVYGFFMLPDTPLFFFAALFLWGYKQFLHRQNWWVVIILSISMAGMMYSKYHAALFIILIILSNFKILLKRKFWAAILLAILLYAPHLNWLYETDFVSLRYHLVDRADSQYKLNFTLDYLASFFGIMGVAFPLIYWAFLKHKTQNSFDNALKYLVYGVFIFFLFSSFNRRTQAQWPVLVSIPLIIIAFSYAIHHKKFKKWLVITSSISLIAILFLRFALVYEQVSPITYETHGNKKWVKELYQQTKGLPVVFKNSYSDATMYSFYSGVDIFSFNGIHFRENQFDIDSSEYKFQHKKVAFLSYSKDADSVIKVIRNYKERKWKGVFIDDFISWRKLKAQLKENDFKNYKDSISFTINNPYNEDIAFEYLKFYGLTLNDKKRRVDTLAIDLSKKHSSGFIPAKSIVKVKAKLKELGKLEGEPFFRITISENNMPFGFQGNIINIETLRGNN